MSFDVSISKDNGLDKYLKKFLVVKKKKKVFLRSYRYKLH